MHTFADLVASRKAWIAEELIPWCAHASLKDLRLAELEWADIAGKVDPQKSLWYWAWGRFPQLVHPELMGIDETREVQVTLRDGRVVQGFPDARESRQGQLVLIARDRGRPPRHKPQGPFSIDEITAVGPVEPALP